MEGSSSSAGGKHDGKKGGPSSQGKHHGSTSPGVLVAQKPGPSSAPDGGKHDKASSSGRHGRRSSAGSHERALASGNTSQAPSSSSSSGKQERAPSSGKGDKAASSSGLSEQIPEAGSSSASTRKDKAPGDGEHSSTSKQEKSTPSTTGKQKPSDHLLAGLFKPPTSRGTSSRRQQIRDRSRSRSPLGRKPAPASAQQGVQCDVTSAAKSSDVNDKKSR